MVAFPADVPELVEEGSQASSLRLRAHRPEDIDPIVVASNDPDAQGFLNLPHPYSVDDARGFVRMVAERWAEDNSGYHSWAIESDGRYAGNVSVKRKLADAVEIGYLLHPDARGSGVATRAAALALGHAASSWSPSVFHWRASVGNWASRAVAWKLGFTVDGRQPCASVNAYGEPQDEWFGHRDVEAPGSPAHPWWTPPTLTRGGAVLRAPQPADTWLGSAVQEAEAEAMASGRSIGWVATEAGGDPLAYLKIEGDRCSALGAHGLLTVVQQRDTGVADEIVSLLIAHAFSPRADARGLHGLGLERLEVPAGAADGTWHDALVRGGFGTASSLILQR